MAIKPGKDNFIKRLYNDIKAEVVAHQFRPGKRINVEHLAERKRVSTTPVREVLNGLVAEKLVVTEPKLGFFMKRLSENELRDLYTANHVLLSWCLSEIKSTFGNNNLVRFPAMKQEIGVLSESEELSSQQLAVLTGKLFLHLAKQANNGEFIDQIANFNDRLEYIRTWECDLLNAPKQALKSIVDAYTSKDFDTLKSSLKGYYDSRLALSQTLIKTMQVSLNEEESIYR